MAATYAYLPKVPVEGEVRLVGQTCFPKGASRPDLRMPLGEELANVLLLACCYQEVSRSRTGVGQTCFPKGASRPDLGCPWAKNWRMSSCSPAATRRSREHDET